MKNLTVQGNISNELYDLISKARGQGCDEVLFRAGAQEGEAAMQGKDTAGVFVDEILLNPLAVSVIELIRSGKMGKVQSIDVALNCPKAEIEEKIWSYFYFGCLLCESKVIKRCLEESEKGYFHGYCAYELENGGLIRIMYASAPEGKKEYLHIYGNEGEIRADFLDNKGISFFQIPNYAGDEVVLTEGAEAIVVNDFDCMCVRADALANVENI